MINGNYVCPLPKGHKPQQAWRFNCFPKLGTPHLMKGIEKRETSKVSSPASGEFEKRGKKYVRVISHDLVRDVLVPAEKSAKVLVLSQEELTKLRNIKSSENIKQKLLEERAQKAIESEKRKQEMLEIHKKYAPINPNLSELELKANIRAKFLFERAQELNREQEDEMKFCNGLILSKKCQAIRDAQIAEKKQIQKEQLESNKRIQDMMENERKKATEKLKAEEKKKMEKQDTFVKELKNQLRDKEAQRESISKIIEMESKLADEMAKQVRAEELKRASDKIKKQNKLKAEIISVNEEMKRIAEAEHKKRSMIDLKIQECLKAKALEEAKREEEMLRAKVEREKEIVCFKTSFQKQQRDSALKEHMMVLKIQDEVEKKWREQEKAAAMKRAQLNATIHLERERQIEERRMCQAAEIEKQTEEREKMARLDRMAKMKEKEEEEKRRSELESYRKELLKQISEKEEERIKRKKEKYEDGVANVVKFEAREKELKSLMKKKMDDMRMHRIPEKYIKEIEMKLNI